MRRERRIVRPQSGFLLRFLQCKRKQCIAELLRFRFLYSENPYTLLETHPWHYLRCEAAQVAKVQRRDAEHQVGNPRFHLGSQPCGHLLGWSKDGMLVNVKVGTVVAMQKQPQGFTGPGAVVIHSDVKHATGREAGRILPGSLRRLGRLAASLEARPRGLAAQLEYDTWEIEFNG